MSRVWLGNCGIFQAAFYEGKQDGGKGEPAQGILEAGEKIVEAVDEYCRNEAGYLWTFVADAENE